MCKNNYDSEMKKLQELSLEWAAQFDKKPALDVVFSTKNDLLTVNGICINCPVSQLNIDAATYDAEIIYLPTVSGSEYEIYLEVPFEGPGRIGYVKLITPIYCAEP